MFSDKIPSIQRGYVHSCQSNVFEGFFPKPNLFTLGSLPQNKKLQPKYQTDRATWQLFHPNVNHHQPISTHNQITRAIHFWRKHNFPGSSNIPSKENNYPLLEQILSLIALMR